MTDVKAPRRGRASLRLSHRRAAVGYDAYVTSVAPTVMERARLVLAHAAVQRVADLNGVDLLHVKGYATDPAIRWEGRISTDVDVLARPAHIPRLIAALTALGWNHYHGFETGSPFGHAHTLLHEIWGYVDIHRHFPGIMVDRSEAFERLWADRGTVDMGGITCAVPSLPAQRLILVLHAARLTDRARGHRDVEAAWDAASEEEQRELRQLVEGFRAEVAFAAAVGGLDAYRDRPEYLLWRIQSQGGTRMEEWRARIRVAPTARAKIRLVLRAPLVNVEHLAVVLGHQPTRAEVVREFFARPARGVREEWRRRRGVPT